MALMKWDDEEDKKDDSGIQRIASVQSNWQPAASGANTSVATNDVTTTKPGGIFAQNSGQSQQTQSYLMSEEKAINDENKRKRDAQIAEARRQAAAQAALVAQQQAQQQTQQSQGQPLDLKEMEQNDGWRKYYDQEFKKEKDSLDFWGRLMDGGAASRRAEVNARNKYTNELLRRAYDDNGNVLDANAGLEARKVAAYNSMQAAQNQERSMANARAIGATKDTEREGIWNRLKNAVNAQRQMSIYDAIAGVDDKRGGTGLDDVIRFVGNFGQNIATAPTVGGKALGEGIVGQGTDYTTGYQRSLNAGERAGRFGAGAIDIVGSFLGGSGKLFEALAGKVITKTATEAEKTLFKRLATEYVIPSLIEGGENAVQGAAEYFGNGGALRDENGEFDVDKFAELATQTAQAGALGVAGGAAMSGIAGGINRVRGRNAPDLPAIDPVTEGEGGTVREPVVGETNYTPERGDAPAFDTREGVDLPSRVPEIGDSRGFTPVREGDIPQYIPVGRPVDANVQSPSIRPEIEARPVDTPVETPNVDTAKAPEQAVDKPAVPDVKPVADGDAKVPVLPTEEVKALQDSIPGKSQAEEARINQRLQEVQADVPRIDADASSLSSVDKKRLRKQYQKAWDVETNPTRRRQISKAIADLNKDSELKSSEAIPDWERQRQRGVEMTEIVAREAERGGRNKTFASNYRKNVEILRNGEKNTVYQVDPKTGEVAVHPSTEILQAFSRSTGEDLSPAVIGNQPGRAGKRLDNTTGGGVTGTYNRAFKRIDYTEKRSVYHETVHHIDLSILNYRGKNPKMLELQELRRAITPAEVRRHKLQDSGVKNVEEYVAHAMDLLLDGRIRAGQLGNGVLKYIKAFFTDIREAFTSAAVYKRKDFDAVDYVKQLDRVINEVDAGLKMPKQKPLPKGATPVKVPVESGNLPKGMGGEPVPVNKTLTPKEQFAQRMMMKTGSVTEIKKRIADAVGLGKDASSEIEEILSEGNIRPKDAKKVRGIYNELEAIYERNSKYQKQNRQNYKNNKPIDEAINKARNRDTRREGELQQQLETILKKVQRQGDAGERVTQTVENITAGRLANMLTSTGNVSRNLMQEIGADFISVLKNPIKTTRGAVKNGNLLKAEGQRSIGGWKNTPTSVSEGYKYILGNTYKTAMTPVSAGQRARVGAMRTELTKWAAKEIENRELTNAQAESLSRTLGNYTEAMANTLAGIDNGMVSSRHAMETLRAWKKFVKSGETADLLKFESLVERQSTLASKMMKGVFEGETKKGRVVNALLSNVFPYVRTAWNLASTGVTRNLNPISKSVIDEIRADQLGKGVNTVNILKNKLVDYGLLTGAAMLVNDKVIVYNDGDEVDQPRGISIRIPGSDEDGKPKFVPVRATPIELPLAVTVAAARIAEDVASGDVRDPSYYGKIISGSVPYVDAFNQTTGVAESIGALMGEDSGDGGYAAKAYGVNTAKSFVPWSNNGIEPQLDAIQGRSTPARTAYDENVLNWFGNTLNASYGRGEYLPVSRDAAGRARTKDNQGVIINKTISDAPTAEFNDRISELVEYGRKNGLGKATQDMFNTFDNGKNNNFKTIQNTIWAVTGKEGNDTKLEPKDELYDLSQQIRSGFFDGTGSDLLTIGDQNLYSDVSMPNSTGTKNSSKPINMQSITNAIAATDLPEEERTRMFEVSQEVDALYKRVEADEITYEQYESARAELETEYTDILSSSESYQKLSGLMEELDSTGFFDEGGLGSTRSGQTYLWNALNTLLAEKGKTPAADYPKSDKGFTPWGRGGGSGIGATNKPGDRGSQSIKWSPVQARRMAQVKKGTYTPFRATVKLGNEVKKDRTQNYVSRNF